ncbi:MAG: M23 family metallopeptidase [Gemmatimonadota bacterium]|nr:M23 family metallopeptidase [Gemmatimonadota bacterium]
MRTSLTTKRTRVAIFAGATSATVLLAVSTPAESPARDAEMPLPAPEISWEPSTPAQGQIFLLRVHDTAGGAIGAVEGRAAGETLHFSATTDGGSFESLVPIPIEQENALELTLTVVYEDGRSVELPRAVPVAPGAYEHERLTVAPRYGTPPDSADQARLARDRARAREVSEAAHGTPRMWTRAMVLPREDRVTSGFGNGREFNGQIMSRHMGLDLDGETGDTVYAATRGVVELVDEFLLAGNIVYLNHGAGLVTGYFHLSEQLVAPGDTVAAGDPVGRVGATGRVTGPHLHWVVRYGHTSVDPRSLLTVMGAPAP